MTQRFTIRVRRGLQELAMAHMERAQQSRAPIKDKDVLAALAWIEQECKSGREVRDDMPSDVPSWAKTQFGGQS